jgi:cytochrome c oxidase subunit II
MNAPRLAGQSAWYLKRQINNYKRGLRGTHPEDSFGQQMIGMVATLADDEAVDNVVAHILTLPDRPAQTSVEGDTGAGARHYKICAYCHGDDGMGVEAMNAPRVAGMSDWYLSRQLENFKTGVRGGHPQDHYGMQMGFMGRTLHDERAIRDVVAYMNSL